MKTTGFDCGFVKLLSYVPGWGAASLAEPGVVPAPATCQVLPVRGSITGSGPFGKFKTTLIPPALTVIWLILAALSLPKLLTLRCVWSGHRRTCLGVFAKIVTLIFPPDFDFPLIRRGLRAKIRKHFSVAGHAVDFELLTFVGHSTSCRIKVPGYIGIDCGVSPPSWQIGLAAAYCRNGSRIAVALGRCWRIVPGSIMAGVFDSGRSCTAVSESWPLWGKFGIFGVLFGCFRS